MYAMGMLVGAYIIRFVPEVASWLIPGGVSSGAASPSGSVAMGAAMMGGSAALKATNVTRNVVGSIGAQAGRNLKHTP
jgi:hypothetical protein